MEGLLLALHLAPDAIEVLRPTIHLATVEPHSCQAITEELEGDAEAFFPFTALGGHLFGDFPERLRLQQLEGQIFEFPLEATDPEPVGQGGINLPGLSGDALLLLPFQRPQRAHVVQTVGQLHEHHPDVAGHRQEHFAQVFCLGLGAIGEVETPQLGDPLHERPHLRAKMLLQLISGEVGVFHHIVEKARGNHRRTGTDIPQKIGHRHGVNDVGVAAGTELTFVELEGEIESGRQQRF